MGQASQYCGKSVTITNTANGKTVVAIVQVSFVSFPSRSNANRG
jgi:hypothetical protein